MSCYKLFEGEHSKSDGGPTVGTPQLHPEGVLGLQQAVPQAVCQVPDASLAHPGHPVTGQVVPAAVAQHCHHLLAREDGVGGVVPGHGVGVLEGGQVARTRRPDPLTVSFSIL